jgi:hypothetical protein
MSYLLSSEFSQVRVEENLGLYGIHIPFQGSF